MEIPHWKIHSCLLFHIAFTSYVASGAAAQQIKTADADSTLLFDEIEEEQSAVVLLQSVFTRSSLIGSPDSQPKATTTPLPPLTPSQKRTAVTTLVLSVVLIVGVGVTLPTLLEDLSRKGGNVARLNMGSPTLSRPTSRKASRQPSLTPGASPRGDNQPDQPLALRPVVEEVEQQCKERPGSTAITYWEEGSRKEMTYLDFWMQVLFLRKALATRVKPGEIVVLCLDRSVYQVLVIYAVLASGAAWVPVDPSTPRKRIEEILEATKAALLVYQASSEALPIAQESKLASMELSTDILSIIQQRNGKDSFEALAPPAVSLDMKAVIFFTSGSTGKPKGIIYSHRHLAHGAKTFAIDMQLGLDGVAVYKTPFIWAVCEYELFPALMTGGKLVVADASGHKDPIYLASLIKSEHVTAMCTTSKVLDILLNVHDDGAELESLKDVLSVGEALPVSVANRFLQTDGIKARLHNCYGASETGTTLFTIPSRGSADTDLKMVPAGTPQAGVSVYLLDENGYPVTTGAGEICFGGPLADGYLENLELTAEKFRMHPIHGRLYHTGDVGSWSGNILHVSGRLDRQAKIRGVRIEVEEVEAVIAERKVDLCFSGFAVVATSSENPELVAILAPDLDEKILKSIEAHCKSSLPVAYLPSHFISVSEMPQLPNGKNDLKSLVSIATTHVGERLEETVDSLGLMQKMSKSVLEETAVIQRCYTLWMSGVVIGHWGHCGLELDSPGCVEFIKPGIHPSVELFFRTFSNDSTMMGFLLCGAWQDSLHQRVRLGAQDVILAAAYIFNALLLAQVLSDLAPGFFRDWELSYHNWYLLMILWARLSIRIFQAVGLPSSLQVLCHVALSLGLPSQTLCVPNAQGLVWVGQHLFPYYRCAYQRWVQNYTILYVIAFHYLRPTIGFLRPRIRRLNLGPREAMASFGLSIAVGAVYASAKYPSQGLDGDRIDAWLLVDIAVFTLICALVCFAMSWCPISCKWPGGATLGTYMCHFYAQPSVIRSIVSFAAVFRAGALQVLIIFAWPLFFTVVFGPLVHYAIIVAPQLLARKAYAKIWDRTK